METRYRLERKSHFQLKERLARQGLSNVRDSLSVMPIPLGDDDEILPRIDEGKADSGNCQLKVRFGRRRTHNEQLVVACCGVIIGRATMFGSEGVAAVKVWLISVVP
jgi:hypothetical protein